MVGCLDHGLWRAFDMGLDLCLSGPWLRSCYRRAFHPDEIRNWNMKPKHLPHTRQSVRDATCDHHLRCRTGCLPPCRVGWGRQPSTAAAAAGHCIYSGAPSITQRCECLIYQIGYWARARHTSHWFELNRIHAQWLIVTLTLAMPTVVWHDMVAVLCCEK